MKRKFSNLFLALCALGSVGLAETPIGTAISYQGRLASGGAATSGVYPMTFRLWDAATDGNLIGPTLIFDGMAGHPAPVAVIGGLFTVSLDFGPGAFGPNASWLEVTVDGDTLSPRTRLAPAPTSLFSAAPWTTEAGGISYRSGNVAIGATPSAYALHVTTTGFLGALVDGQSGTGTWLELNNRGTGGRRWALISSGFQNGEGAGQLLLRDSSAAATRLSIDTSGRVGIGTATPAARLEVLGSISAGSNATTHKQGAHLEWNKSGSTGETWLLNQKGLGSGGIRFGEVDAANNVTERMRIEAAGNVGIGTTTPQNRLHVAGNVQIDTGSSLQFGGANENTDEVRFRRYSSGTDRSTLELKIGDNPEGGAGFDDFVITAGSMAQFQFTSDSIAVKRGFPVWDLFSDARMKHDIEPLQCSLDRVLQLQGKSFYYNDPNALGARPGHCIGFIAQEVEPYFPDWVGTDRNGRKILHIAGFEALTVEALRELRREKDEAIAAVRAEKDAEIATLTRANEQLSRRIERLEAALEKLNSTR